MLSANFKVPNVATGTTDNLNGSFDVSGVADFDASGFALFAPGFFAGSVFFDPTNAFSGLRGAVP